MKSNMAIPGVALWGSGQRIGALVGWVLIVASIVAVLIQLATPGAVAALTTSPMAHTVLGVGAPSVILYTSEIFLAAAIANSMLYRSRHHLALPAVGRRRTVLLFLCPRLALTTQPDSADPIGREDQVGQSQPVAQSRETQPLPTTTTAQRTDRLATPQAQQFLNRCATMHVNYGYLGALAILANKGYALAQGTSWYVRPLPTDFGLVAILGACLLLFSSLIGIWLTITLTSAPDHTSTPASPGSDEVAEPRTQPHTSGPNRRRRKLTWMVVLACLLIAVARFLMLYDEATSRLMADGPTPPHQVATVEENCGSAFQVAATRRTSPWT